MPYCYYTCNLLPLDLLIRRGWSPRWLGGHLRDANAPARRDALGVHPMTCPFVTKLVAAAQEALAGSATAAVRGDGPKARLTHETTLPADRLIVPGGCDAMRRLGDLLTATYPGRVFLLPMPRSSGPAAARTLAADLRRLDEWLIAGGPGPSATNTEATLKTAAPAEGDPSTEPVAVAQPPAVGTEAFSTAPSVQPPSVDYPAAPRPGGVFVVAGPLSDDSLLRLIDRLGAHVSGLESCTSPDRWRPLLAASALHDSGAGTEAAAPATVGTLSRPSALTEPDYESLATGLLDIGMCPRRSTGDRRRHLARRLDETKPSSIIYARQSFCDPGAYDALLVSQLAEERRLPYLEIEVDFPFDAGGPLCTRVEAFLEAQLLDEDLLDHNLFAEED